MGRSCYVFDKGVSRDSTEGSPIFAGTWVDGRNLAPHRIPEILYFLRNGGTRGARVLPATVGGGLWL